MQLLMRTMRVSLPPQLKSLELGEETFHPTDAGYEDPNVLSVTTNEGEDCEDVEEKHDRHV